MKEAVTSKVRHVSRKPLQCIAATTPLAGHVVEVIETIAMPMICSLIEHSFLPVFLMVGKIMLHSDIIFPIIERLEESRVVSKNRSKAL